MGIVSLLLDRGADVNLLAKGKYDYGTALIAATREKNTETVAVLLDKGADPNIVVKTGEYGTALIAATCERNIETVAVLLNKGADPNIVGKTGKYGTALIAAAYFKNIEIVSLLLDRGADANVLTTIGDYRTPLIAGVCPLKYSIDSYGVSHDQDIVLMLLDLGADVNVLTTEGKYGTALIAAIHKEDNPRRSEKATWLLLLDRGADVNLVAKTGKYGTALIAAAHQAGREIVSVLLDRGADVNVLSTIGNYGTPLIAAACRFKGTNEEYLYRSWYDHDDASNGSYEAIAGNLQVLSLLLDRGADVNLLATNGTYGTALIAAADLELLQSRRACNIDTPRAVGEFEVVSLLLSRGADVNLVTTLGNYGTALVAAAIQVVTCHCHPSNHYSSGDRLGYCLRVEHLLRDRGADVSLAFGVAMNLYLTGMASSISRWDDPEQTFASGDKNPSYSLLSYFLDELGADINVVCCDDGSALAKAVCKGGQLELISFLLNRGADPFHVGGKYKTYGYGYPTALDVARSSEAKPELTSLLSSTMTEQSGQTDAKVWPPFPMPYTGPCILPRDASSHREIPLRFSPSNSNPDNMLKFHPEGILNPEQANLSCSLFEEEVLMSMLVELVGIHTQAAERLEVWIRNDVGYFILQGYDLGLAYAAACVGWKHFNESIFNVAAHRAQWLKRVREIDEARNNAIYRNDTTMQELIKQPYQVMPRRIWDVKSNRVVEFQMLYSEALESHTLGSPTTLPAYWAITHSWASTTQSITTSINQYQWPVPLPQGLDLEHDLRKELQLLGLGTMYIWLDVLCLRQFSTNTEVFQVPADTLNTIREQEWKIDVPTIGNVFRGAEGIIRYFNGLGQAFVKEGWDSPTHWLKRAWTLQEIRTEQRTINGGVPRDGRSSQLIMNAESVVAGNTTTLRRALRPVLKLAAVVDSPGGCSIYELAREMAKRFAAQPTDKVAGLLYLLRATELPTYSEKVSPEDAWAQCFGVLPFERKIEILFDFPYRAPSQHWIPTWSQLLDWPEYFTDYDYAHTVQPPHHRRLSLIEEGSHNTSLFVSDIWAISHVHVHAVRGTYQISVKKKDFEFYPPYISQIPIQTAHTQLYTIATLELGHCNNWIICEVVKKQKMKCKSTHGKGKEKWEESSEESSEVEVEVLMKVGVLRTDSGGELWLAGMKGDSIIVKINAVFV